MPKEEEFELEEKISQDPNLDDLDDAKPGAQLNRIPSAASITSVTKGKRPPDTAFRQQRLPAWRPILTPYNVIPILIVLGVIFIPLGIIFLHTSTSVQEYSMDYTQCLNEAPMGEFERAPSKYGNFDWRVIADADRKLCEIRFKVTKEMSGPVLLYYRLTNYYQNQRLYVKSVDWDQLKGDAITRSKLDNCNPLVGPDGSSGLVYYPCGLIANSYFNDIIGDPKRMSDNQVFAFPPKDIAWSADKKRYGPTKYEISQVRAPPFWQSTMPWLVNPDGTYKELPKIYEDERFMVWMRVAGLPAFMKPYGKRPDSLPAGTYTVLIDSIFEVISYGATKSIVFSTTSWMGGKNSFLGIAYTITGSVFIGLALIFLAKHLISPRPLGDLRYLSWRRSATPNA